MLRYVDGKSRRWLFAKFLGWAALWAAAGWLFAAYKDYSLAGRAAIAAFAAAIALQRQIIFLVVFAVMSTRARLRAGR